MEKAWSRITNHNSNGCIHLCTTHDDSSGIMIRRPSEEAINQHNQEQIQRFEDSRQAAINWAAYLAKTATKGNAPYRVREYQGSRL